MSGRVALAAVLVVWIVAALISFLPIHLGLHDHFSPASSHYPNPRFQDQLLPVLDAASKVKFDSHESINIYFAA